MKIKAVRPLPRYLLGTTLAPYGNWVNHSLRNVELAVPQQLELRGQALSRGQVCHCEGDQVLHRGRCIGSIHQIERHAVLFVRCAIAFYAIETYNDGISVRVKAPPAFSLWLYNKALWS